MSTISSTARQGYNALDWNLPTRVHIPGTNRYVVMRSIHPFTVEKLTHLWCEKESVPNDSAGTLKSMAKEPYFAIKEAVLLSLNCWWKILLLYPIKWRIWAYFHEYTEEQMTPIITEGKKKLPLTPHWMNMAYSVDMRTDWMKMTNKEAEQYRAELLSVAKQLSLKNSPAMGDTDGASETSSTDAA